MVKSEGDNVRGPFGVWGFPVLNRKGYKLPSDHVVDLRAIAARALEDSQEAP